MKWPGNFFSTRHGDQNGRSLERCQTHGTAMGTKKAVALANIFMARVETEIVSQSAIKPLVWKRYIDYIFFLLEYKQRRNNTVH